ncbi:MAG: DUF1697 domain-containing protein [Gemmatimonadetes bacterium]|nr:DUF1697 domain-containing protein [Gemmatimonadota bacterium]
MTTYIALLRAVNVGGTGKLPMADLRALCTKAGFTGVRTYIASGNVVFSSGLSASKARVTLEAALAKRLDKGTQVIIRTADELEAIIAANPFPEAEPNRLIVVFLSREESATVLDGWKIPGRERLALVGRELFIHYPDGMGQSKLKVPFADQGTGRNMNSVRALLEMARARV